MSDYINDRAGRSTKVTARSSYPQPAITTARDLVRCSVCQLHLDPEWFDEEGRCEPCSQAAVPPPVGHWDVCPIGGEPSDRGECPKHERSRER